MAVLRRCRSFVLSAFLLAATSSPAAAQSNQVPAPGADVFGAIAATRVPARSPDGTWSEVLDVKANAADPRVPVVRASRTYRADAAALARTLAHAPLETKGAALLGGVTLTLPLPDGTFARFTVERTELFSPELQARFPEILTFRAQGIDDPTSEARLEISPFGFRAWIEFGDDTALIEPAGDGRHYMSFWKSDAGRGSFACDATAIAPSPRELMPRGLVRKARPIGNTLRTYRFAATLTGEYTTFFAGPACPPGSAANCPQTAAAASLATTMNRVTGIFERGVAVRFNVVATNIYANPATDPFTNGGTVDATLLNQNQADVDTVTGAANYDIGHIFSQGGAGGSAPGQACGATKARGGTSLANPAGDPFDVDFVAHEVGHQLSGRHTWTGTQGFCSADQFTATSAYEPGSGSTIMAYAGVCGADNLQPNSDAYFHNHSFDQITDFRNNAGTGGSCGTVTNTGNNPPTVSAGADFTIPRNTPFVLTATGGDPDGDTVTFAWEQFDTGAQVTGIPPATQTTGPLFRSFAPAASTSRTLPTLASLLGTAPSPWEVLPNVDRTLTFRVTVRDNRAGGGGVDFDTMVVNVAGAPFFVTQPGTGSSLQCGTNDTLVWTIGGGNIAPNVGAQISTDNGATFAPLIGSTANDGSEPFPVPRALTANGRVRVAAIGNIFFDISDRFSIVDTLAPSITAPAAAAAECTSPAGTPVAIGAASATDVCDFTPAIGNNAPALFPLGTTIVSWIATDDAGNVGSATQLVTVSDTKPPVVTPPPNITAECTSPAGTPVAIGTATAVDVCDATLVIGNNAPPLFPLGTTTVTWSARDDSSNVGTAAQLIRIVDTTPPVLELTVSPNMLWPPNHKLWTIAAGIRVVDVCDPNPQVRLLSIASNEPDDSNGDGETLGDIQQAGFGADDREFLLRAERRGPGEQRIYTITYEARDASGNATMRTAEVAVPHDK